MEEERMGLIGFSDYRGVAGGCAIKEGSRSE